MTIERPSFGSEARGGIEGAIQGFATSIGPLLLFLGLFGLQGIEAGLWATLITASVVHWVTLIFRSQKAVIPSTRVASLTVFASLVLQIAYAEGGTPAPGSLISIESLRVGLAAGSLMFLFASVLVLIAGLLQWGNLFKMIPTPVTAGISNGTAMVLVWLAVMQVQHSVAVAAVTAICMVVLYLVWPLLAKKIRALGHIPAVVIATSVGFLSAGILEPAPTGPTSTMSAGLWQWTSFMLWPSLMDHNVSRILGIALPGAVTLALVMTLETFTAANVMESRFGARFDASREMVVLGSANVVSAMLGGVPSTGSPVRSLASWNAGGRAALASVICLMVTVVFIVVLSPWLVSLPAGVVAGLFLLQASLLVDRSFVRRAWQLVRVRDMRSDGIQDLGFWITLVIALVAAFGNLVWACSLGIGLSCLLVLRRVSGNLTAQWSYLSEYSSRRVRSSAEVANLQRMRYRIGILRLTGYLFFGNSVRLSQLLEELNSDAMCVVIDVSQVSDVDPSGIDALSVLISALAERQLTVMLTGIQRSKSKDLRRGLQEIKGVHTAMDLDRGLEICENQILLESTVMAAPLLMIPLANNSLLSGMTENDVTSVLMLGEERTVKRGEALFHRGEPADGVWLIESGMVSIVAHHSDSSSRLSTFGPGQFVGEMGFVDGGTRSATAIADKDVHALLLDHQAVQALVQQQPEAVLHITRNIARELSQRVRNTSALMSDESSEESTFWANSSLGTLSRY